MNIFIWTLDTEILAIHPAVRTETGFLRCLYEFRKPERSFTVFCYERPNGRHPKEFFRRILRRTNLKKFTTST